MEISAILHDENEEKHRKHTNNIKIYEYKSVLPD